MHHLLRSQIQDIAVNSFPLFSLLILILLAIFILIRLRINIVILLFYSQIKVAKLLLKGRTDITVTNNKGVTPVSTALLSGL